MPVQHGLYGFTIDFVSVFWGDSLSLSMLKIGETSAQRASGEGGMRRLQLIAVANANYIIHSSKH